MANEEQLSILKQGSKVWNEWIENNTSVKIDLRNANLEDADLQYIDFGGANLVGANLKSANLLGARFWNTELMQSNLTAASLMGAELFDSNLTGSIIRETVFIRATLRACRLSHTDMTKSDLRRANLVECILSSSKLSGAKVLATEFANLDLSNVLGLDDIVHTGPSSIGIDTLIRSRGNIPESFMKGCGLSDVEIEFAKLYSPALNNEEKTRILYKIYDLRAAQAIQISPLFISYSHGDGVFVDKIEGYLNRKGIRFWRDINDMKAGRMEKQIDTAMRLNPTVLLILSKHSLASDWVEHEVRKARSLEKEMGKDILCPVALDDSWKNSPWAKRIMEQIMEYNILDFSAWKDDTKFESTFNKLINGLELFYK